MPLKTKHKPEALVLAYLLRYGSITRSTALTHFRVWNLPAIISKVKRETDYKIKSKGRGDYLKYSIPDHANKYKAKDNDLSPIVKPNTNTTNQPTLNG